MVESRASSRKNIAAIGIICKAPQPGRSKTRLASAIASRKIVQSCQDTMMAASKMTSALPASSWRQVRNQTVQPLPQVPARGLPVIVTGSPGTARL